MPSQPSPDPHRTNGREVVIAAALVAMHVAFATWALALLP